MTYEFEAGSESEAVEKAALDLGLRTDEFDVELLQNEAKRGLFGRKKGLVKIRVHVSDDVVALEKNYEPRVARIKPVASPPENDIEVALLAFIEKTITLMGFDAAQASIVGRNEGKLTIDVSGDHASLLIGKKGKNLDALQLVAGLYLNRVSNGESYRVIMDVEDYRHRREDSLVRLAEKTADIVTKTKTSKLLEPMNPFERRLVHTALNDRAEVITQSEGDGLYKQIRIIYKGGR